MFTYEQARDYLAAGRNHDSRKIANNTWLERRGDDFAVRLHATDVVTIHANDTYSLNTGGWFTVTTKDRMNNWSPARVWSDKGVWVIGGKAWEPGSNPVRYSDGITIDADGNAVGDSLTRLHDRTPEDEANAATSRAIDRYVKGLTPARIAGLYEMATEGSTAGDCLFCQLGTQYKDPGHLREHIAEGYYMATLCANALTAKGYRYPGLIMATDGYPHDGKLVRGAVRQYLRRALITGRATR